MSLGRTIEYANRFSDGPVAFEYLLPLDSSKPSDLASWVQQFTELESRDVFAQLSRQWEPTNSITKPVVDFFSTLEPTSIYVLPDEWYPVRDWLLLKNMGSVFFFTEPSGIPDALADEFENDVVLILRAFNGIRIGFRSMDTSDRFLRQDSGFQPTDRLRVLEESDETWLRSNVKSIMGCLPFFSTPCGNMLLAFPSGVIAKWDKDSTITICFESVSEFVTSFIAFYTGIDTRRESPFFF